ncbi:MAG: DNA polymerase III subunit gamma/tau, partial [Candidatus Komeilibacteria bacterium]|nr:DNA polymerase III subunit gamma/tau [Candidatus Komeilibacteria bacterium]
MSTTLYRKYRPQTFGELVYQTHVVQTLQNQLGGGKVAHAYLFSGPRGLGKTTVARILAKAVNCQNLANNEPCNNCSSCLEITSGNNIDLIEIDAASNRGIEDIRELREQIKYAPVHNKYKVYIIDEVHMLTKEAFNALLKTLEEPPAHALFILATTEAHKLPETIVSRCQHFDFKKVPLAEMMGVVGAVALKEGVNIPPEAVEQIARLSQGHVRDALSLLGQILALGEKDISLVTINAFLPQQFSEQLIAFLKLLLTDEAGALVFVRQLVEDGIALEPFIKQLLELTRLLMVGRATGNFSELDLLYADVQKQELIELSKTLPQTGWLELVKLLAVAIQESKSAEIATLPLEILVITFVEKRKKTNNPPPPPTNSGSAVSGSEPKVVNQPEIKPTEEVKESSLVATVNSAELGIILNQWLEILESIRVYNHSVAAFIKQSHPLSLADNVLTLGFQHSFHWDQVKERKYLD